jgi:hypothetical protein
MAKISGRTTTNHSSNHRTLHLTPQTLRNRITSSHETVNPEEDDTILNISIIASDSTIFPMYLRRENNVPAISLPQISSSSETKELLVNLVNLLQRQKDLLERTENDRRGISEKISIGSAIRVPPIHGNRRSSFITFRNSLILERERLTPSGIRHNDSVKCMIARGRRHSLNHLGKGGVEQRISSPWKWG